MRVVSFHPKCALAAQNVGIHLGLRLVALNWNQAVQKYDSILAREKRFPAMLPGIHMTHSVNWQEHFVVKL